MRAERRDRPVQLQAQFNPSGEEAVTEAKPYEISREQVAQAWRVVKANRGAGGVDGQTLSAFEKDLEGNLYKIWNRMSSGSYFPPPVRLVEIPKGDGRMRPLGIPTVADRVAQMVAKQVLEPLVEPVFHPDSYGYRPGRSALDAVGKARERCFRFDWVIDLDIKGFFDNLRHDLMLKAVRHHTDPEPGLKWIPLYVERWLKAPLQREDGTLKERTSGTPQGGVASPVLANLFMHYAFDAWMVREFPKVPFERYADDAVIHCVSLAQAELVLEAVRRRLKDKGLELHPDKTRIVYCKDDRRGGDHEPCSFDFLGYTFRRRSAKGPAGNLFVGFLPAMSEKAKRRIREVIRSWRLATAMNTSHLEEVAARINPAIRGWVGYYGRFYRSECLDILNYLNLVLARWAKRKFKRFHRNWMAAYRWLGGVSHRQDTLFHHWSLGIRPKGWTGRAG
ncbi:group II intron reverse transcriptase/maturase [Holophaga foetida]|uniref:group II intron reverse transcriptase/maturase n=1 Tax=Holophaga foetida TaxID=35839 RepID=UPI0009FF8C39